MPDILVVEDHDEWRSILKDDLELEGYTVDLARSLDEAMSCLHQKNYLVVVTDISLSEEPEDTGGIVVLKWIKNFAPSTRTIAISGRAALGFDEDDFKRKYGVFAYIDRINYDSEQFAQLVATVVKDR